ncbi:AP endonuclease family 2 C terminus [Mycobacterium sp. 455mf]|nr:AP endonuclease family 2 C terminus [Mycobacterium sp. 455mf]
MLHAAAKDTRVNPNCSIYGVLDDRFTRIPLEQNPTGLGGRHVVNRWPEDSAWDFVAVGQEHGVGFWSDFLRALERVDPGIWVNIEHEDLSFGPLEGLRVAAETLKTADATLVR